MSTGRITKLTPERQELILTALRAGNTRRASAAYAGVSETTLLEWMARGEGRSTSRPKTDLYASFAQAVKKAEADAEIRNVAIIHQAATDNWTAAAWWLERRRHQDWKKVEGREMSGPDGGPIPLAWDDDRPAEDAG